MLSRWGRHLLALAAAFAVCAIATPAFAAAPICDPHGATGIAPAPQLQQPETSIDLGLTPEECDAFTVTATTFEDGRAPEPTPPSAGQEPVVESVVPAIAPAASAGCVGREETDGHVRAGERVRVDRPPRA